MHLSSNGTLGHPALPLYVFVRTPPVPPLPHARSAGVHVCTIGYDLVVGSHLVHTLLFNLDHAAWPGLAWHCRRGLELDW